MPLVLRVGRLVLKGPGPFEGCFIVRESIALEEETSCVVLRGFVHDSRGTSLASLPRPLAVVFDPRLDPTGVEAHLHYRSHLRYGAGPRIMGHTGRLIDTSDYRRPAAAQ